MKVRSLVASLCFLAAAGCSGGSGSSAVPGSGGSNQSGGGTPAGGGAPFAFTNTVLDNISPSDPNYLQPTLVFGKLGLTLVTTVTEKGYSGTFNLSTAGAASSSTCPNPSAVFSVSTTNNKAFSIKALGVGLCKVNVTSGGVGTSPIWISVSTVTGVGS